MRVAWRLLAFMVTLVISELPAPGVGGECKVRRLDTKRVVPWGRFCNKRARAGKCITNTNFMLQRCRKQCRAFHPGTSHILEYPLRRRPHVHVLNATRMMMDSTKTVQVMDELVSPERAQAHFASLVSREYLFEYDDEHEELRAAGKYDDARRCGTSHELLANDTVVSDIMWRISEEYPLLKHLDMYRAYAVRYIDGDHPFVHCDRNWNGLPPHVVTIVYYAVPTTWSPSCGGETMFLNYDKSSPDITKSVLPRPGRAVIFFGDIRHAARPPLPLCTFDGEKITRQTVVLKFCLSKTPNKK